jgi:glucose-1-phosphate cytidylyltransferase
MKSVILAGGLGTRLAEETVLRPKPMVEIGGKPILWHIMKGYAHFGITDFVICLGYKGYMVKEYFANYLLHMSDVTIDIASNRIDIHQNHADPWKVTLVDTGDTTQTAGRLKRVAPYLDGDTFCMTYGDGLSDVDIGKEIAFHRQHGGLATICAVQPPGRFGALELNGDKVSGFKEKPLGDGAWINGGFFVLSRRVLDFVAGDQILWEREPLEGLADAGELSVFRHTGFWQPMDTLRDKNHLEGLWASGNAPWKVWNT